MSVRVVVCDVGLGNLRSVERALQEASRSAGGRREVEVTSRPDRVATADRLVLPGQAAFGDYARALSGALGQAVREHLLAERPYLGICMGLQVLFEESEEAPGVEGLGMLPGKVARLHPGMDDTTDTPRKVPHIGWNTAEPAGARGLLAPGEPQHFYFVHSFVVVPRDVTVVAARTTYGESFVSAVAAGCLFACQFHPEKSQHAGIALLERFLAS